MKAVVLLVLLSMGCAAKKPHASLVVEISPECPAHAKVILEHCTVINWHQMLCKDMIVDYTCTKVKQ